MCWLDSTQFAVLSGVVSAPQYFIVRARDATVLPATLIEFDQNVLARQQTQLQTRLQAAQQVYVLLNFEHSGYTIFVVEEDQLFVYFLHITGTPANQALVDSLLQDIPHTRIPDNCDRPGSDENGAPIPLPSPDSRLVALKSNNGKNITITDQSGRRVAAISKDGWHPYIVGWAHDSSGLYVQFMSSGASAAVTMLWKPIVKLSPLTPQEEVVSWISWLGGGTAVVAGLWWYRRRRVTR